MEPIYKWFVDALALLMRVTVIYITDTNADDGTDLLSVISTTGKTSERKKGDFEKEWSVNSHHQVKGGNALV